MLSVALFYIFFEVYCGTSPQEKVTMEGSFSISNYQQRTLVIQGIFNKAGDSLLEVKKPVLYNRTLSRVTPDIAKGRYNAVILYQDGQAVIVPFNALVSDDSGRKAVHGFFELQIPVREGITSIKISQARPGKTLAVIRPEDIQRDP